MTDVVDPAPRAGCRHRRRHGRRLFKRLDADDQFKRSHHHPDNIYRQIQTREQSSNLPLLLLIFSSLVQNTNNKQNSLFCQWQNLHVPEFVVHPAMNSEKIVASAPSMRSVSHSHSPPPYSLHYRVAMQSSFWNMNNAQFRSCLSLQCRAIKVGVWKRKQRIFKMAASLTYGIYGFNGMFFPWNFMQKFF